MTSSEKKRDLFSKAVKFVAGTCTGTTTTALVKNLLPETEKASTKIQFMIGSAVIGGMVAAGAREHTGKKVDEFFETIDNLKEEIAKEASEEDVDLTTE